VQVVGGGDEHGIGKFRFLKHVFPGGKAVSFRDIVFFGVTFVAQGNRFRNAHHIHFSRITECKIAIHIAAVACPKRDYGDRFCGLNMQRV
jgi:hypothetical protein